MQSETHMCVHIYAHTPNTQPKGMQTQLPSWENDHGRNQPQCEDLEIKVTGVGFLILRDWKVCLQSTRKFEFVLCEPSLLALSGNTKAPQTQLLARRRCNLMWWWWAGEVYNYTEKRSLTLKTRRIAGIVSTAGRVWWPDGSDPSRNSDVLLLRLFNKW